MRGEGRFVRRSAAMQVVLLIASVFISCSASWPVSVSSSSWESTESISSEDDGRFDNFLGMKILKREAPLPPGYFQSQATSGGYSQLPSSPSLSYGGVAPSPSLAQGPVIENLPPGQNEIFSSLTSSSPDMFYFSPRDQVLYKVSRLPIDSFNGGAAGLNLGAEGAVATTPATTPAPALAAVQSTTPPSSPFNIGFEVEEETGGEYVGGFGASSSTTTTTPAPPVAQVVTVTPSGGASVGGGGAAATPNVQNNSFMTQLINAATAAAARPPTPGPGPAPGLVMPAAIEAISGYRSKDTDDVSSESEYGYTPGGYGNLRPPPPSSMYGSQTEQFSQVVLPPQIRISPQLSEYLTRLRNQNNIGSGSGRNSVIPSSALPENLDAATGTPGQQQRRVFKRMNFRAGGAIG